MIKNKMDTIHMNPFHITDIKDLKINGENCTSISENTNYIIYVSKDGNDETGNGSFGNPFLTITFANNYAVNNMPGWPMRVIISVAPGLYRDEHIAVSHYRCHIMGQLDNLDHRERSVILANFGTDPSTYPLAVSKYLNLNNITIATMDDIYDDYVDGVFGTIMAMSQFSNCTFLGGWFVEQEADDANSIVMNFDGCYFGSEAFKLADVNRDYNRFIAIRNCDISSDGGITTVDGTGSVAHTLKIENCLMDTDLQIKGDWDLIFQWSEIYESGKITFDTDGFVNIFSSVIINGIHFTTDTPQTKKLVSCLFRDIPEGVGDVTADCNVEFIEYSGNHQANGIDGEIITVSKIKNVGGGQNMYRSIHEALQGSLLTDTIINLEGDVEVSDPLVVNPNIDVQIDGNKKWKLNTTHATTLCDLGENQQLSFVNMKSITGGKKAKISSNGSAISFVSCGRFTNPCYINLEINTCNNDSYIYSVKSTIIGTEAPVILSNCTHAQILLDRSHIEGALNHPGIKFTTEADNKLKCKNSTLIHGGGTATVPMENTSGSKVTVAIYGTAMNANFPTANFDNSVVNASNVVDVGIIF